jgi:hypothetical protein
MTRKTEPDAAPDKIETLAPTPAETDSGDRPIKGGAFVRQSDGTLKPDKDA